MPVTTVGIDLAKHVFQVHGITKDGEAPPTKHQFMQSVTKVLIFVDEQHRKSCSQCGPYPAMLLNHTKGNQPHVVEFDQPAEAQFRVIGFDEICELRIGTTPVRQQSVDIKPTLFFGKASTTMGIELIVKNLRISDFDRSTALRPASDAEIIWQQSGKTVRIGQDHLRERKAVDSADEGAIFGSNTECGETCLEFNCAFVIVGNTCDSARIDYIFNEAACHRRGQSLGFAAAGFSQDNAMAPLLNSSGLFGVECKVYQRVRQCKIARYGRLRT